MTDRSIAELKRQLDAANSRYAGAAVELGNARRAFKAQICANRIDELAKSGIVPGAKVILCRSVWGRSSVQRMVVGFLGVEASEWSPRPDDILSNIKKDGTPSASKRHFGAGTLEPWEGSPEQAQELGK
jgi:hypothetical protein